MYNDAGESVQAPISATLKQRGLRYGEFTSHALTSQNLQTVWLNGYVNSGKPLQECKPFIREAVTMICHKLARIANGDPMYDDNWRDIEGYSRLVVDILQGKDNNV